MVKSTPQPNTISKVYSLNVSKTTGYEYSFIPFFDLIVAMKFKGTEHEEAIRISSSPGEAKRLGTTRYCRLYG